MAIFYFSKVNQIFIKFWISIKEITFVMKTKTDHRRPSMHFSSKVIPLCKIIKHTSAAK